MACAGDIYLGIDIGTSSVKVVFLGSSPLVSGASRELDIDTCGGTRGCCEQNPGVWIEALHEAISKALESNPGIGKRVKAIGVSGQQHGMVTLGEDGEIIRNCMLWCDTQAIEESKLLSEMAAYHIPAGFTGPKIMWLKKHEPLNFCKTARILLPHDYINFYLSGGKTIDCMEAGDASGCGFFDSELRAFDIKLMEYIDSRLASMLPKCALVDANSAIGMLDSTVAAALGLGSSGDNIIIAPGSGDNAMSALASGANKPGSSLVLSLGTSGTLAACSRVPVLDPSGVVAPFCDATGNWLPLVCIQNCTQAPEEIRQSRGLSVDQICLMAENEPAGSLGVVILPFFNGGERTPDIPVAAGTIHGLRTGYLSRSGLLYRAALEGVTFGLYRGYLRMLELGMTPPGSIRVIGGASTNKLWCQIISDIFQLPVTVQENGELAAALGAALQAGAVFNQCCVGSFAEVHAPKPTGAAYTPNIALAELYEEAYRQHAEICRSVHGV